MIWPPRRISVLLSQGLVHPCYRLSVFCPMKKGRSGFEPDGGKEKVYRESIQALQARSAVAKSWRARRASWLKPLMSARLARCFEVVARTRVVLWLSSSSATELGFCLHHVYGLPYLPPTALKGLASKAMWQEKAPNATWQNPARAVLDLFGEGGDHDHEGRVAFLGGIPLGDHQDSITLDVDVMTPHHAAYYAGLGDTHDCEPWPDGRHLVQRLPRPRLLPPPPRQRSGHRVPSPRPHPPGRYAASELSPREPCPSTCPPPAGGTLDCHPPKRQYRAVDRKQQWKLLRSAAIRSMRSWFSRASARAFSNNSAGLGPS